jgi:transcriptional regulator with XRE-family HTH domain
VKKRGLVVQDRQRTLGAVLRGLRSRKGWTLKEMSEQSGIPISTLSKVEHDRLTLTYDKLQQVSQRLNIRMSDLFAEDDAASAAAVMGRRSIGRIDDAVHIETPNYDYSYLCTELRQKRMIPIVARVRAKTLEEFGAYVRHAGEEFVYVLEGRIVVHSEFYDPVELVAGESIYLDSSMGHAYLAADGCDEAVTLGIMSSAEEDQMSTLITMFGDPKATDDQAAKAPAARRRLRK